MIAIAKEVCIKCGRFIHSHASVRLVTVSQLSKIKPNQYVDKIVQAEGISRDIAQDYVDHQMGLNCTKSEPPCPGCGAALKTWHATCCLKCEWKRDPDRPLPLYYE